MPILIMVASINISSVSAYEQESCGEVSSGRASCPLIIFIGADRDVAKMGQLERVTREFKASGYNAVYFDPWKQFNDDEALANVIRQAVQCQGQRVMLVGWSFGTVVGLKALQILEREGICVETFIELDCFNLTFYMGDHFQPSNARRVIVIRSKLNGPTEGYRCAEVHKLESYWHLGVPTHRSTRCVLLSEANKLY